uniref:beta-lactamase n=1 Tax=Paulinella longichromatophora TaxID=1708747 RepID=A0A2H4ZPG9_9EUKA|nr:putative penicillin-binding protein [Paulinella longichromatophora]
MFTYRSNASSRLSDNQINRSSFLLWLLLVGCGAIVSRLAWLQVLYGPENKLMADQNRIRLVLRPPIRGRLLDRQGVVLATNSLRYNIYINPPVTSTSQWPELRYRLSKLLHLPSSQIEDHCNQDVKNDDYRISIAKNLSPGQVVKFFERRKDFENVGLDIETFRSYPHGSLGAHVMGYTGTIAEKEYSELKTQGYHIQDRIGRSGIERACESTLRGDWGSRQLEVNAFGEVQRWLGSILPSPGQDIQLTLDFTLQQAAEKALRRIKTGAIVAMDPETGAIRAMASGPSFDPNIFSPAPSIEEWKALNSTKGPLVNRALRGFPPASTFKVVSTIAAIESGKYTADSKILSSRSFCSDGQCYSDHVDRGLIDFPTALAISSNTVYYRVGLDLGAAELFKAAYRMGYGFLTGIELAAEESPGLLGDGLFKKQQRRKNWNSVDTIVSAIGQGMLQVTPLQMARLYAAIANGGWLVTPHLVEKPTQRESTGLKPETLAILHEGLRNVITKGTATVLNDSSLPHIAGKTGTAENPPYSDHTWFAGYVPAEKPNLVIVVFCQNSGGFGGTVAAPIAKTLLNTWFQKT